MNLYVPMAMMGVAFSLIPAVMWPSVAYIVEQAKLGTAYGLMTMIQNIGLFGFNLLIGWANDYGNASAANPAGYHLGMWIFSVLGFLGVFLRSCCVKERTVPTVTGWRPLPRPRPRPRGTRVGERAAFCVLALTVESISQRVLGAIAAIAGIVFGVGGRLEIPDLAGKGKHRGRAAEVTLESAPRAASGTTKSYLRRITLGAAGTGDLTDAKKLQGGKLSEAEAIERAKQGDAEAFETLYHLHKRRVYSLCLRMTANTAAAEDLTQEAFLQLFRKIGTFRGESAFSTWLHRMAVNVVLMQLRKKGLAGGSIGRYSRN